MASKRIKLAGGAAVVGDKVIPSRREIRPRQTSSVAPKSPLFEYSRSMAVVLPDAWSDLLRGAVAHYWKTLHRQSSKQIVSDADRGRRSAVTGGKQMNGFCELVTAVAVANGMPNPSVYVSADLEIPGFFRPTKRWDMLVVHRKRLVAALEFKSQRGPSFGNNFNNRTEEAVGTAHDLWTAYREGAFGKGNPAPWVGWVMLLEDSEASTRRVSVQEPHFNVFDEFRDSSYSQRYEILLRKLVLEKLYNAAAFLTATESGGPRGKYSEPAADLSMRTLLLEFAGHVATQVAIGE